VKICAICGYILINHSTEGGVLNYYKKVILVFFAASLLFFVTTTSTTFMRFTLFEASPLFAKSDKMGERMTRIWAD